MGNAVSFSTDVNPVRMLNSNLNVVIYSSNYLSFILYSFKFFVSLICFFFKLRFNLRRKKKETHYIKAIMDSTYVIFKSGKLVLLKVLKHYNKNYFQYFKEKKRSAFNKIT